ncbi:hypothetical protein SD81_013115 [Tolypothrix campylonemoides VB511288]|nr:hypothetical protein SD81_013115 [Tolypothrix campylonemoides VB511288]
MLRLYIIRVGVCDSNDNRYNDQNDKPKGLQKLTNSQESKSKETIKKPLFDKKIGDYISINNMGSAK